MRIFLTISSFTSLFISEQSGTNAHVLSISGGLLPQAGEAGRRDEPRPPRQWLWAWAQTDSAVQWTHPQSLSEWEHPPKESQWLAGASTRWLTVSELEVSLSFFFALGNKLLPHIEAIDPEPPGSGLKGSSRGASGVSKWSLYGRRPIWAFQLYIVKNLLLGGDQLKEIVAPKMWLAFEACKCREYCTVCVCAGGKKREIYLWTSNCT